MKRISTSLLIRHLNSEHLWTDSPLSEASNNDSRNTIVRYFVFQTTIVLACALLFSKPLLAQESDSYANDKISIIEDKTSIASEPTIIDSGSNSNLLATDTIKAKNIDNSEKINNDKLWIDYFSGKKLKTLENNLCELQNIYNTNYKSFRIAKAINNTEKAKNYQKRNNDLLLDISREQTFTIYSIYYIFPELLKNNIQDYSNSILEIEKTLTDEIVDKPEEINNSFKKIEKKLSDYDLIYKVYSDLASKIENSIRKLEKPNYRTNDLTNLGFYIKKTNKQIFSLLKEQLDSFSDIVQQFNLTIEYSKEQIDFINKHYQTLPQKCKYLSEIRSSFNDLGKIIERYESKQEFNIHRFNELFSNYYITLDKLIGNDEIREGRIKKYIKDFNFKPVSKSLIVFNAEEDLKKIFCLLEQEEINSHLCKLLLPYINGDSWQVRYEEKTIDDEKDGKKDKKVPKLIDFEE